MRYRGCRGKRLYHKLADIGIATKESTGVLPESLTRKESEQEATTCDDASSAPARGADEDAAAERGSAFEVSAKCGDNPGAIAHTPSQGRVKESRLEARATIRAICRMTSICRFFQRGLCSKGRQCTFAHSEEELAEKPDLTRTALCKKRLAGECALSQIECYIAHGEAWLPGQHGAAILSGASTDTASVAEMDRASTASGSSEHCRVRAQGQGQGLGAPPSAGRSAVARPSQRAAGDGVLEHVACGGCGQSMPLEWAFCGRCGSAAMSAMGMSPSVVCSPDKLSPFGVPGMQSFMLFGTCGMPFAMPFGQGPESPPSNFALAKFLLDGMPSVYED